MVYYYMYIVQCLTDGDIFRTHSLRLTRLFVCKSFSRESFLPFSFKSLLTRKPIDFDGRIIMCGNSSNSECRKILCYCTPNTYRL